MKSTKRILTLLLAVILTFSLMPVSAFASGDAVPDGSTVTEEQESGQVDDTGFFREEQPATDIPEIIPEDTAGPEIEQPLVTPQLVEPGQTVSISAVITHTSAVEYANIYLIDPNRAEAAYDLYKNGESDEWRTDIALPGDASEGVWSIRIEAFDEQGSFSEYTLDEAFTIEIPFQQITDIVLNSSVVVLNIGKTAVITAAVSPDDATDKTLDWTSSAPAVATVDEKGKVTAVKAGSAVISASAKDGSGKIATCSIVVLPASVSGPKAVSAGYNSVKLSWNKIAGASGYEIYRSVSSGSYKKVGTVNKVSTVSFTNTELTSGKTYYYKVRAYGMNGSDKVYTGYSAVVKAKPVPAKPTAKAVSASYTSAKVSWNKVSGATGYEVHRAASSQGTYTKVSTISSGDTVSFTNKSLTTGKTYYYKVRAYRTVSGTKVYGSYSAAVNTKPVPIKPGGVKAVSAGYNAVKVSWKKVTGATGYQIYRAAGGGTYTKVGTVTGNSNVSFTNSGLTSGKTYSYKVRAYRKVGSSNVYGSYSTVVKAKPLPVKVSSPKAVSSGYDRIKVSWRKTVGASGYEIYRAASSNGAYSRVKTVNKGSTLNFTNTGLKVNQTYYYKVRAYRTVSGSKVYGSYSSAVKAKTALNKVSNFKANVSGYKSVKLSWSKVSGADGYEIYRAAKSSGTYSLVKTISSGSVVTFTNTDLSPGSTYYYKIRPYRIDGGKTYGGFSSVKSASPKYGTVYWVPNGSVFHVSRSCPTLSRSKIIHSGTTGGSGKSNCCKVCG